MIFIESAGHYYAMLATMNKTLVGSAKVSNPIWLHQVSVTIKPNLVETSPPKHARSSRQDD
ncbi:hypothetical protein [Staphylococcus schleiferi]|uniref:hypothetical protein n=1 Tax=Staphylococcus schleiferi TaxID=1295 RepID=UPI0014311E1A|nr:hypothetical protein [Staphylococcus schleiferi]